MDLLLYKTLAAFLIFVVAFLMTVPVLFTKRGMQHSESMELGDAFASGVFLGAALLHLLPDALQTLGNAYPNYPVAEFVCALGFLGLLFLERITLSSNTRDTLKTLPYLLTATLMIHSFIEGGALGLSPTLTETSILLIAIIAHKGAESFALTMLLLRHRLALKKILYLVLAFTLMTPLGIAGGSWVAAENHIGLLAGYFNAFAAGTFLYISTLHHGHFHEHAEGKQGLLEYLALAAGTLLMSGVAIWT